jgi:hypothetical protein
VKGDVTGEPGGSKPPKSIGTSSADTLSSSLDNEEDIGDPNLTR